MSQININLEQPPQLGQTPELRSGTKWLNRLWILLNDIKSIANTVSGIDSTINSRIDALDSAKSGINDAEVITGLWDFSTLPTLESQPTTDKQAANKKYVDDSIALGSAITSETVTTNTTASKNITLVDCSSGDISITLPNTGLKYEVSKIDSSANKVIILPTTGTIMGETDAVISRQFTALQFFKIGTVWRVL